jgi:hypothetical protein
MTLDFKDGPGSFKPEEVENVRWYHNDGAWRILLKKEKWTAWTNSDAKCTNCVVEVSAEGVAGPDDVSYGIFFRYKDNQNYYAARFSDNGKYSIGKMITGKWTDLAAWTSSSAIKSGKNNTNVLRVVAVGNAITMYANGQQLITVNDDNLQEGSVCMVATTYADAGFEAAFRKLQVWQAK